MRDDLLVPSPRELAGAVRRRWWLALLVAIAVFLLTAAYLGGGATTYSATAKVLTAVLDDRPQAVSFVDTELQRLRSGTVVAAATERLGTSPDVSVGQIGGSVFSIEATGDSPAVVDVVNAYAAAFVEVRRTELKEQYASRAAALEARIAEVERGGAGSADPSVAARRLEALAEDLDETVIEGAAVDEAVRVFEEAEGASSAIPSSSVATLAGAVLALLAGLLAPFAYELLRGRVNTSSDVERLVPGLRVLAATSATEPDDAADVAVLVRLAFEAGAPGADDRLALAALGSESPPPALAAELARQLGAAGQPDAVDVVASLDTVEGLAAAAGAGRVVVTATAGRTRISHLRDAIGQLEALGATVVGVVLAGVNPRDRRGTA